MDVIESEDWFLIEADSLERIPNLESNLLHRKPRQLAFEFKLKHRHEGWNRVSREPGEEKGRRERHPSDWSLDYLRNGYRVHITWLVWRPNNSDWEARAKSPSDVKSIT